jgi:beta-N-acetylhexosaminidase
MKRNIQSASQTRQLVDSLQTLARDSGQQKPLLIGIDQENGLVSAFSSPTAGATLPGAMALAATQSPELVEQVYRASGAELKAVGINWVYSPVADVNTDSRNPVIGVRSFGDDPKQVAALVTAASRGSVSAGVASSAKHFPGHGDTHVDSHLGLPRIEKTKEQIDAEELVPFRALVAEGVPSIMIGHMALPLIIGDDTPCSVSKQIVSGILRDEMGYEGVVVTDCLEMDAVAEGVGISEGSVRALDAGVDVVMICHTFERHVDAIQAAYRAIENGRLDTESLRRSGDRIARMKDKFTAPNIVGRNDWDAYFHRVHDESLKISREAYPRSTSIVWDSGVLPLPTDRPDNGPIVLLTPMLEAVNRAVDPGDGTLVGPNGVRNTAGSAYLALAASLEKRTLVRHVVYGDKDDIPVDLFEGTRGAIFVMRNADLKSWQLARLKKLDLQAKGVPVVLVSSCGPYDLAGQQVDYKDWTAYVATYEFTAQALEAAVAVIFGEVKGTGKMPVNVQ